MDVVIKARSLDTGVNVEMERIRAGRAWMHDRSAFLRRLAEGWRNDKARWRIFARPDEAVERRDGSGCTEQ
jgi:hypothetical protein